MIYKRHMTYRGIKFACEFDTEELSPHAWNEVFINIAERVYQSGIPEGEAMNPGGFIRYRWQKVFDWKEMEAEIGHPLAPLGEYVKRPPT